MINRSMLSSVGEMKIEWCSNSFIDTDMALVVEFPPQEHVYLIFHTMMTWSHKCKHLHEQGVNRKYGDESRKVGDLKWNSVTFHISVFFIRNNTNIQMEYDLTDLCQTLHSVYQAICWDL